jgi:hypothetical protein
MKRRIVIFIAISLITFGLFAQDREHMIRLGDLMKPKGNVFAFALDQNLRTTDSPTFVRLTLSQATGTAPLTVASTTVVANLNADLLDGNEAAAFALSGHTHAGVYEPAFGIGSWAGTANITTLGTIGTGSWHGTEIAADHGGTGQTSYTVGDILHATSSSAVGKLADVAVGQVLASGGVGAVPAYTASPTLGGLTIHALASSESTIGNNILTNGDFATNDLTNWTAAAGWSAATGVAIHTAGIADVTPLTHAVTLVNNGVYQVIVTCIGRSAGTLAMTFGALTGNYAVGGSNVTFEYTFTATSSASFDLTFTPSASFNGGIDNVTVKMITANATPIANFLDSTGASVMAFRGNNASFNTAIGHGAGRMMTTGYANNFYGDYAGYSNTTGYHNNFIGYSAGYYNTDGYANNFIGYRAGVNHVYGYRNNFIGPQCGFSNISGNSNIFIGYQSGYYETGSSKLFIDNISRASEADGRVKALIYGEFASTTAAQNLYFNSKVYVSDNIISSATWGTELITFDGSAGSGTNFTWDGGFTWGSSKFTHNAGSGVTPLVTVWTASPGVTYKIVVTTTDSGSGDLTPACGTSTTGQVWSNITASGTNTYYIKAIGATTFSLTPTHTNWTGTVTALSIMADTNGSVTAENLTINSGQSLFSNGNVVYPSIAFGRSPSYGTGFYYDEVNDSIRFGASGVSVGYFGYNVTQVSPILYLSASTSAISRESNGVFQFGIDAASPAEVTIHGADGTGSDKSSGGIIFADGVGTGAGIPVGPRLKSAYSLPIAATASTLQTLYTRKWEVGKVWSLVNNTDTPIITITCAAGTFVNGKIIYSIEVINNDGSEMQCESGETTFAALQHAAGAAYHIASPTEVSTQSVSTGTLATTWAMVNGSNVVVLSVTSNSDMTMTSGAHTYLRIQIILNSPQTITLN